MSECVGGQEGLWLSKVVSSHQLPSSGGLHQSKQTDMDISFAFSILKALWIFPLLLPIFPSCVVLAVAPAPPPPSPPPLPPPPPPSAPGEGMNNNTSDLFLSSSSANVSSATTTPTGPYVSSSSPGPFGSGANSQFNPSMAIVIVVLLSAFFFMGFFSVYVRRCTTEDEFYPNNAHNSYYSSSSNSFYNGNLSFRSSAMRQLQAGEDNRPPHGLDLFLVNSLPTVRFSREEAAQLKAKGERKAVECVVCLSEFQEGEALRWLPKCGHSFHQDCIDLWLFSHTTCPLCRRSLLHDKNGGKETGYGGDAINPTEQGGNHSLINTNDNNNTSSSPAPASSAPEIVVDVDAISHDCPSATPTNPANHTGLPLMITRSHSTGHSLEKGAGAVAAVVGDIATDGMRCSLLSTTSSSSSHLNLHNLQAIDVDASNNHPALQRSRSYTAILPDLEGMSSLQAIKKQAKKPGSSSPASAHASLQPEWLPPSSSKRPTTSARSASPPIFISKAFKRLAGLDMTNSSNPFRGEFLQLAYVL